MAIFNIIDQVVINWDDLEGRTIQINKAIYEGNVIISARDLENDVIYILDFKEKMKTPKEL